MITEEQYNTINTQLDNFNVRAHDLEDRMNKLGDDVAQLIKVTKSFMLLHEKCVKGERS